MAASIGRRHGGCIAVDVRLARLVVPYDDWEVLYRQRLQVERELHRRADARDGGDRRSDEGETDPLGALGVVVEAVRRLVR